MALGAETVYDMVGTRTSEGYPNNFDKGESWRFRVSGAYKYDLHFEDIDLDPEIQVEGIGSGWVPGG